MSTSDKVYYKAVNLDYSAHQPRQGIWEVGSVVEAETPILTVGDAPHEVPYISLPMRLITVEAVEDVNLKNFNHMNEPHMFAATSWKVTGEIESWRALGTNGEAVQHVVERTPHLDEEQLSSITRYAKTNAVAINACRNETSAALKKTHMVRPYYFILRNVENYYCETVALAELMKEYISSQSYDIVTSHWHALID